MIKINNLVKSIDKNEILKGINLEIKKGSAFGLLGSNGAGKSTLLRLICGIYEADSGELTLDGKPVFDRPDIKEKIFFINDETVQFTGYTLKELKNFYKSYYPLFSEELFESLRQKINLPLNKKLSTFSKGMKRQAIVIVGIACRTEYLLLDEAFDGLDPTMRIIVNNIIFDAIVDRQTTFIISSHNLREISEICDTAAMMFDGKIIFCHETDDMNGICKIQAAFPEVYEKEDFSELDLVSYKKNQSIYTLIVRNTREEAEDKLRSKNPAVLDIVPLTLEETFIYEMEAHGYDSGITKE
jgi:ABC-2 type transport system ATP-binding protein